MIVWGFPQIKDLIINLMTNFGQKEVNEHLKHEKTI